MAPPLYEGGGWDDCMDTGGRVTQDAVTEGGAFPIKKEPKWFLFYFKRFATLSGGDDRQRRVRGRVLTLLQKPREFRQLQHQTSNPRQPMGGCHR